MKTAESDGLPTGSSYAYHVAPVEVLDRITDEGLRPDCQPNSKWQPVNDFVVEAAAALGNTYPVNRNRALFLFDQPSIPTSWAADKDDYAVLAVSLDAFNGTLYCAEMGHVTTLIEEHDKDAEVLERALRQYRSGTLENGSQEAGVIRVLRYHVKSVEQVPDPTAPVPTDAYGIELFTEATISASRIVDVCR